MPTHQASPAPDLVARVKKGRGEVDWTIANDSQAPMMSGLSLVVESDDQTPLDWLTLDNPVRYLLPGESQSVKVAIEVPRGTPIDDPVVRLRISDLQRPSAPPNDGPRVLITGRSEDSEARTRMIRRILLWIVILVVVATLGLGGVWMFRSARSPFVTPVSDLEGQGLLDALKWVHVESARESQDWLSHFIGTLTLDQVHWAFEDVGADGTLPRSGEVLHASATSGKVKLVIQVWHDVPSSDGPERREALESLRERVYSMRILSDQTYNLQRWYAYEESWISEAMITRGVPLTRWGEIRVREDDTEALPP